RSPTWSCRRSGATTSTCRRWRIRRSSPVPRTGCRAPLNVALVGSEADIQRAFAAAGWSPADPITLRSSLGIAESVVLDRPDPDAPISTLLLFGRHQDLAFEKEVGTSARERNRVRFWRTNLTTDGGRPVWVGAATFDRGVG